MSSAEIRHPPAPIAAAADASPMRKPFLITDDFLPADLAAAMRQDIENHFAKPQSHRPETHQIWNYWYIPELYTYLRTNCDKVIDRERMQQFATALTEWSIATLGMGQVTWPYLSLYVSGCKQSIHNDSTNGRFAFVYSLTKNERKTSGGETIVLKEGDLFRRYLTLPNAGRGFYDLIAPRFNRLAVFDDRMPHGVERVDGSMDPVEGRFVLHGHISESGPIVQGSLALEAVMAVAQSEIASMVAEIAARPERYHGPVVLRFSVLASGIVIDSRILVDRVARSEGFSRDAVPVAESLRARVTQLKFPPAFSETQVTLPLLIGGPLPWMEK